MAHALEAPICMEFSLQQKHALILAGRILLALIFVTSGLSKIPGWQGTLQYMQAAGIPFPPLFLCLAIVIEVGAGIGVLVGYRARASALVLALYLVPVTLIFHAFWNLSGMDRQMQFINFMKNLAIMGGLLAVSGLGPGALSLDARRERNQMSSGNPQDRNHIKLVS